jgi:hypothetical protein
MEKPSSIRGEARGGGHGVDVEVRKAFELGEPGVVDAAGAASFGAFIDFGGEHFGEVSEVGLSFTGGDFGESGRFGAHGRQVQLASCSTDARLGPLRPTPGAPHGDEHHDAQPIPESTAARTAGLA